MGNEALTLAYLNENDRAYGLAGMAISLAATDAIDMVSDICLDSDGPMVEFTSTYYYGISPTASAKSSWNNLVHNFQVTTAMALSNLIARSMVRQRQEVPGQLLDELKQHVLEEGLDTCGLEADEAEAIFNHELVSYRRLFRNPRIHPAVEQLVKVISIKRRLSSRDLIDQLRMLQIL